MKGLAIYTLVLVSLMALYTLFAPDYPFFTKIVCIGMYTPMFILAIKCLK